MNETKLRAWVAKALGERAVPHHVWNYLRKTGHVADALEMEAEGRDGRDLLLRAARDAMDLVLAQESHGVRREPVLKTKRHTPDLLASVTARAEAEAEAAALAASRDRQVRRFRDRYLGGRALSDREANHLLRSPAAAIFYEKTFERCGIPVVGHRSRERGRRLLVRDDGRLVVEIELQVEWDGGSLLETSTWGGDWASFGGQPRLASVDARGDVHEIEVWHLSILDRLRELGERLAKWYDWEAEQAVWFVLTDRAPARDPFEGLITVRSYPALSANRVSLSVPPWMPADVVAQTYRDIQRDLLGKGNRPLTERNLDLLRFVLAQEREAERTPAGEREKLTWAKLTTRWNEVHPERRYAAERLFARDVNRVRTAVLFPNYRLDADQEVG